LPVADGGCAAPQPRFDERSYLSVFLFVQHTLIPEIFVFRERSCPIATIVTRHQSPPAKRDHGATPDPHEDHENGEAGEERRHGICPAQRRFLVTADRRVWFSDRSVPLAGLYARGARPPNPRRMNMIDADDYCPPRPSRSTGDAPHPAQSPQRHAPPAELHMFAGSDRAIRSGRGDCAEKE
jgi:hypothetical protein